MASSHVNNSIDNTTNPNGEVNPINGQSPIPPTSLSYAKAFLDISKIEVFDGNNFKRWQERVNSILDVHGVAFMLARSKPKDCGKQLENWVHANKVCRYTIISALYDDLFDVYCSYKEAKEI